jgi:drug/metabolite transporter (DMT)-like permease
VDYPHAGGQALRYGAACLLLLVPARRGARARLRAMTARQWVLVAATAAVGMVGFNLSVLAAERTAEPAVPGVLVGCAPIVVAVLVPLASRRRPSAAIGAFVVQGWGGTDGPGLFWRCSRWWARWGSPCSARPWSARWDRRCCRCA